MKVKIFFGLVLLAIIFIGYSRFSGTADTDEPKIQVTNATQEAFVVPKNDTVTLTGTYTCLPLAGGGTSATDCAFGIKTDDGKYYAVNFGAGAGSMADFTAGARISAKGTIILSADLNPNNWTKFQSEGLFTVLEKLPE